MISSTQTSTSTHSLRYRCVIPAYWSHFHTDPLVCMQLAVFLRYLSTPELAQFIPASPPTSQGGILLTNVPEFCTSATLGGPCTTAYSQHIPDCVSCGHIPYSNVCVCLLYPVLFMQGHVDLSDVFFAVKTCEKFHNSRCALSCWLQSLY